MTSPTIITCGHGVGLTFSCNQCAKEVESRAKAAMLAEAFDEGVDACLVALNTANQTHRYFSKPENPYREVSA